MRVVLISERWESVTDEGMLVYLDRLARYLQSRHELLVLYERGEVNSRLPAQRVPMGKRLLSTPLIGQIEAFAPTMILYCPTACATLGALYRHHRLQRRFAIPCALLSLQSRSYPGLLRTWLVPRLQPWRIVVLSGSAASQYSELGFEVVRSRAGVDLESFQAVDPAERAALRAQLGLDAGRPLALHVGHLAAYRNLEDLEQLAREGPWQVVMIASTANPADPSLRDRLEAAGVIVLHEFIPHIEDYYRAADLYVFPVRHGSGAIEFPLSVLEAMACNLPVASTPFGALPECFPEGEGLCYITPQRGIVQTAQLASSQQVATRERLADFSWDAVLSSLISELEGAMEE